MLNLPEVARRLLERAGVGEVEIAGNCTCCDAELFYSHRREGPTTGRQGGIAWLA
jgi:copper oxidase (laccase) domain-containing protein